MSLYTELGGDEAITMALDRFYERVLADPQLRGFFDDTSVDRVKEHQRAFLAMAFGAEISYRGRTLRNAHARARREGLDDERYDVFMGHFRDALEELGVEHRHLVEVMSIANTGREDVLGR